MRKRKKYIINIGIIVGIFIALFIYMLIVDGWSNMVTVTKNVDFLWVFIGVACMFVYWFFDALVIDIICKKIYPKQKYSNSFKLSMIGQLFNNITLFSSGEQPVQTYIMNMEGKSVSNSASILLLKFIIFQATHVIYTAIILIFKYTYFKSLISNFVDLALIGFLVNFFVIIILILIGINRNISLGILRPTFKLLGKLRLIKNLDKKLLKLENEINSFHDQFKLFSKETTLIIKSFILTFVQLTAFFSVAYTVYKAFGFTAHEFINILSAQAFLMMVVAFVPTPGAGLFAEGGFYVIFSHYFTNNTIYMATFFWRLYVFYLPILIGGMFMIGINKKKKVKKEHIYLLDKPYLKQIKNIIIRLDNMKKYRKIKVEENL
ncbi:MAG: flippase-like domain-containing protein [Clostridia bacterium]|nr:flippase-like domain-containing protein [Clostridia bacterium]